MQRFRVTLGFNIYRYAESDIDAAVREGISRMAVRGYRERHGAQSWPPSGYLSGHVANITVTLDPAGNDASVELNELTEALTRVIDERTDLQHSLAKLTELLGARDADITTLHAELARERHQHTELREVVRQRDVRISFLQDELSQTIKRISSSEVPTAPKPLYAVQCGQTAELMPYLFASVDKAKHAVESREGYDGSAPWKEHRGHGHCWTWGKYIVSELEIEAEVA